MPKPKMKDIRLKPHKAARRLTWTGDLLASEWETAEKAAQRAGIKEIPHDLSRAYVHSGNFTVALLVDGSDRVFCGVSKRNPIDREDPVVGETIALCRAVREMCH